ncbi:hypothetical protein SAMN02746041_01605 [Desulfacinum hydrothermale DSM 13146]|uniref:Permease n=1 Tax=Desulfacinum hydrothermale DSM 13146 TaxID=1121390 RepID=A0A1W1XG60_9BACT|nr:SO_0444 family Cu/Zn efflux transporter [Desulfacinum hydrothermale]SMC22965.1 hypothetical protein SAMN02746041_01605 [Desulfacinum hydrothermale DSM 13146]
MLESSYLVLFKVLENSWQILVEAAPYILFGLLAAGWVKAFLPEEKVLQHLGGRTTAAVVKASILGIPLPLCSCGVLPVAMDLRKRGAAKGPSAAFLVSVPETGVDSIAITYALLGPVLAVLRPLAALVTATVTGLIVNRLPESATPPTAPFPFAQPNGPAESAPSSSKTGPSFGRRIVDGVHYALFDLLQDLGGWLFAGILISGVIAVVLPQDVSRFLSTHEGWSLVLMLVVGIPIYICASSSTPVAAALILKGLSPGAALVFLLAGPATNTATLTVLARFWGKAVTAVYLLSVGACTLIMGWLTNVLFHTFQLPLAATLLRVQNTTPYPWEIVSGILLLSLYLVPLIASKIRKRLSATRFQPGAGSCSCSSLPGT